MKTRPPIRPKLSRSTVAVVRCTCESLERRMMLSDVIAVGPEFQVNTYTTSDQRAPSTAMDADGDFVVTWDSVGQDGSGYGVFAQRYNAGGVPQGGEFRVNTYTTGSQRSPSVAMDTDGDFVIVWSGVGQGVAYGVFGQRYNAAGVPQGGEFRVNEGTGRQPSVAMDAGGNFAVTWQGSGPSGAGILARRYSAVGAPQGGEFQVNTHPVVYLTNQAIAIAADGDFVIAWDNNGLLGTVRGIHAQRYNAAGVPQGGQIQVNTFTSHAQYRPSVAMDAVGNFLIAWRSAGQESPSSIFAQRYRADGAALGGEFRVNTFLGFEEGPSAAVDGDGNFAVAWQSYPREGSGYGIYTRRYNSAGVAESDEFRVNSYTTNDQLEAAIAMNASGDFVVVWQSDLQDGNRNGIFAQRYAIVPAVTSSSFLFDSSPHRLRYRFNHDVRDSLGTDDLLVQNLTTGQTIPSDQFVFLYDPASNVATFIYLGAGSDSIAGVLPDGRYRATLLADGIVTPQGASPAADHVFDFYFLNGDANRDGRVNLADFNILARHFGQSGTDFTRGDFTYDGTTDLNDFHVLAARFGITLPISALTKRSSSFSDRLIDEEESLSDLLR